MRAEDAYKHLTEEVIPLVSSRQAKAIKAYLKHGSLAKTAELLGCDSSSVRNLLIRAARTAMAKGWNPGSPLPTPPVTEPFLVSKRTTLYDRDGGVRLQWIQESLQNQQFQEMLEAAVSEFNREIKSVKAKKKPKRSVYDLVTLYVLSDIHLGGLSWGEETGEDWDIEIAERVVLDAIQSLVDQSPDSKYGFFCNLGDALHYDSWKAITPTSGNIVDTDSRYPKIVRTAIRLFNASIDMLLEKHEKVVVLHAQGNHDLTGSVWLQQATAIRYEKEPRCEVIQSAAPYYHWLHPSKKLFLGFHHGHRVNINNLAQVFTSREYWPMLASARHAYIHTGHMHHRQVKEFPGAIVEMHQTLAGRSAFEAHSGYLSDRSMPAITYSADGYEVSRVTYYPTRK